MGRHRIHLLLPLPRQPLDVAFLLIRQPLHLLGLLTRIPLRLGRLAAHEPIRLRRILLAGIIPILRQPLPALVPTGGQVLPLRFALAEETREVGEGIGRDDHGGGDEGLGRRDVAALGAAFVVLGAVGVEDVGFPVRGEAERGVPEVEELVLDLGGRFGEDGEAGVDLVEARGGERVRAGEVGGEVALVGTRVGEERGEEFVEGAVGELDGAAAQRVGFVRVDGGGDGGVGGQVGEEFGVGIGGGGFGRRRGRHC